MHYSFKNFPPIILLFFVALGLLFQFILKKIPCFIKSKSLRIAGNYGVRSLMLASKLVIRTI